MLLCYWNINFKSCSSIWLTLCSYNAFMIVNNFFYNRKPNASAIVFIFVMQALKNFKYFFVVLIVKTYSIVGNSNMAIFILRREIFGLSGNRPLLKPLLLSKLSMSFTYLSIFSYFFLSNFSLRRSHQYLTMNTALYTRQQRSKPSTMKGNISLPLVNCWR